jgi:hypothetical protein
VCCKCISISSLVGRGMCAIRSDYKIQLSLSSPSTQFTELLFIFCFVVVLPTWTRCQQPKIRSASIFNHFRNLEVGENGIGQNVDCQPHVTSCMCVCVKKV